MAESTLKKFMPESVKKKLRGLPTTHHNCRTATRKVDAKGKVIDPGVARPGKTARDKAKRLATPTH